MKTTLLTTAICIAAFVTAVAQVPTNNLQLHYLFNGNLADSSGNGRHASPPAGGTTGCNWNSSYTFTGSPSNNSDSAFTGSGCYNLGCNFGTAGASTFKVNTFTAVMWVRYTYTNTYTNLMEIGTNSGASVYLRTLNQGNGYLQFGNYSGTTSLFEHQYSMIGKPNFLGDGNWHFVAVVTEAQSRKTWLYLDGNLIGEYTRSLETLYYNPSFNGIMMGSRSGVNNMSMNGSISAFSFYNRALSYNELMQYYRATTPKCFVESTLSQVNNCGSYNFFGTTIQANGTYTHVKRAATVAAGCDTLFTQQVSIKAVPFPQVSQSGNRLSVSGIGVFVDYQWMKGNDTIPGATSGSYTITESNSYWVKVRNDIGCVGQTNMNYYHYTSCNMDMTHTISGNANCKDVSVGFTNAAYPVTMIVKWTSNPNGVQHNVTTSPYLLTGVCPQTYTLVGTDANNCKDSVQFTISQPVGVHDVDANSSITLYPNPAGNAVQILHVSDAATAQITDMTGRIVSAPAVVVNERMELNTTHLPNGVYFVVISDAGRVITRKLMISK